MPWSTPRGAGSDWRAVGASWRLAPGRRAPRLTGCGRLSPLISENNTATAPRKLAEDEPGARGHRNFHARARYDHKQPRLYSQSVPDLGADTLINTVGSLSIGIEMEAEPDTNPPVVNLTPFAVLTVKASGMV